MLLKGCRKNLVVLRGIGSDYIEEAYLVLRPDAPPTGSGDIVKEANRLVREYETGQKKKRISFSVPSFLTGLVLGCAAVVGLLLLL